MYTTDSCLNSQIEKLTELDTRPRQIGWSGNMEPRCRNCGLHWSDAEKWRLFNNIQTCPTSMIAAFIGVATLVEQNILDPCLYHLYIKPNRIIFDLW